MDHMLGTGSSADGCVGNVRLLAVVNSTAVNIPAQGFVWTPVFSPSGCIPRSGIARPYGNSMFNLLRTRPTDLHSDGSILHPRQQCLRAPTPPYPHQDLFSFCFASNRHPSGCEVASQGFDLHFPTGSWRWAPFHVPLGHLYICCLQRRCTSNSFAHFLQLGCLSFCCWVLRFLMRSGK